MGKYVSVLLLVFGWTSCMTKPQPVRLPANIENLSEKNLSANPEIGDSISYGSANNGLADINLDLLPDQRFNFFMRTIPQPETHEHSEIFEANGFWKKTDTTFILVFRQKQLVLDALFDESFDKEGTFKLVNDSTVNIHLTAKDVWIWGVACERRIR